MPSLGFKPWAISSDRVVDPGVEHDHAGLMSDSDASSTANLVRLHLRFGWTMLLIFIFMGIGLEVLHGFKVSWYLDVGQETRRLMWNLSHAHGTLLSMVNLCFAFTLTRMEGWSKAPMTSKALRAASVLLPGGFFAGGVVIYDGDPGLGIVLVPVGAIALLVATVTVVLGLRRPKA